MQMRQPIRAALIKKDVALNKAVDLCYRSQPLPNQTKHIEFLLEPYDKYTNGMLAPVIKLKTKKNITISIE